MPALHGNQGKAGGEVLAGDISCILDRRGELASDLLINNPSCKCPCG